MEPWRLRLHLPLERGVRTCFTLGQCRLTSQKVRKRVDTQSSQQTIARLLDWYRAMGVDTAVGEEAIVWAGREGPSVFRMPPAATIFAGGDGRAEGLGAAAAPERRAEIAAPSRLAVQPTPTAAGGARTAPKSLPVVRPISKPQAPDAAVISARQAATGAATLTQLGEIIAAFEGCGLKRTASRMCFFKGPEHARLMIVGEAPGRDEDLAGIPFVGPPGVLLDKILSAASIDPGTVHITNMVYWRPPGNRTPTPEEIEVCLPFLKRQIALVRPEIVLVLGAAAAKGLMGLQEGITRVRGQWHELAAEGVSVRAMATLHPEYLLRTPALKRHTWRDILTVRQALQAT